MQRHEIKSDNILASLQEIASQSFTPLSECEFTINSVETLFKTIHTEEFTPFTKADKELYTNPQKMVNEHIEFKQSYEIAVSKRSECTVALSYYIDYGEFSTHPKIIIKTDSHIPYKLYKPQELFVMLVQEINKIKALNKIIINILDDEMIKMLKAFTKHLYAGKFTKNIRIPLFEGLEPTQTQQSRLIMWFEEKNSKHQIIEVEENELLVEFIKPVYGKNGLNCFGHIIESGYVDNKEDLQAAIDYQSIRIEEDKHKKLYISRTKGFVHLENGHLKVDNNLKVAKVSRVQEKIAKEENNNIIVSVAQNDANQDSVGEGVVLTSETVNVTGHVGANSLIEAVNLKIEGATHQDSTQFARYATINRHKGTLRCRQAKVALLEGGTIHATDVEVEASLGGSIYAQRVKIGHVKHNLKVYASESIEIRLVSGESNLFKINYKEVPVLISKINHIEEDIDDLKYKLDEAKRHNHSAVDSIIQEIKELKEQILSIKNSALDAKISIEKPFIGLNTINFTLPTLDELVYKTDAKEYAPFYLEIEDNKITLMPVKKSITLNL